MRRQKKLGYILFCLWTTGLIFSSYNLAAASSQIVESYTIDHVKNYKKAKQWAYTHYNAWNKKLSADEKRTLEKLLEPVLDLEIGNFRNINYQLKAYGGDLSSRPNDTPNANKNLQHDIDLISRAINRKEGKLDKPLIVYKNESVKDVLHIKDRFFRNPNRTINELKLNQLRLNFLYSQYSEFGIYDLYEDSNKAKTIKWKITLPAGTPTGLITADKIIIDKNSAFKIDNISAITEKGIPLIRIEAKLFDKQSIQNEIEFLTEKIRNDFIKYLNLAQDSKAIDFKLTGAASYFIAKKLEKLTNTFITSFNPIVLKKILNFMSEEGGHIIFSDQKLYTLTSVYPKEERSIKEIIKTMNTVGNYNFDRNRTLSIYIPYELRKKDEIDNTVLFHEFGHVVDNYIGKTFKNHEISSIPGFLKIFEKEGKNLTAYGSTAPAEFFAEAFRMIHSKSEQIVQEKAPETYTFIKDVLEVITVPENTEAKKKTLLAR